MDQIKIGKFISSCRKEKNMTQAQLAEKLNITDRAISKWETGRGLPDSAIMLELCAELGITVNELLSGELIDMKNYDNKAEEMLLQLKKENEDKNKEMLQLEIVIGVAVTVFFLTIVLLSVYFVTNIPLKIVLIVISAVMFFAGVSVCLKIEQTAGYYECCECGHKYIPTFAKVYMAMHSGRTRYMKCPHCGKKSWQKKIISK